MPVSLRELYARKMSKDSATQSAINRSLYDEEYKAGLLTGSSVGSGALRNQLLGITDTPQDIVFDTIDTPPPINSKVLGDDLEGLFNFKNLNPGDVKILSKPYKEIFDKLDQGSATDEDYKDLVEWVNNVQYKETSESFGGRILEGLSTIGEAAGSALISLGEKLPGKESVYTSAYKMQESLQSDFDNKKKNLLTKIQQKGAWLQGKKIEDQQTFALQSSKVRRPDEALSGDPFNPLNQIREFNKNFVPNKFVDQNLETLFKVSDITGFNADLPYKNPLEFDPYKQSLAKATLNNLTPGSNLYGLSTNEVADKLLTAKGEDFKRIFGKSAIGTPDIESVEKAYSTQKQILADGLSKKAAYYMKVFEKAQKENNTELLNESKAAIEKIQTWYNINTPSQKIETGFFNAGKRFANTLAKSGVGSFKSLGRFISPFDASEKAAALDRVKDVGETPIAVPLDINSDGKLNNLDIDYYGNPILSNQFHYQGEKGEWKTNWAAVPEISAQVVGQMAPSILMGGVLRTLGTAILPEVAGAEIASGIASAKSLNLAQKGVAGIQALNKWKDLRLADRVGTLATVTASTYDMMLQDELRFTKDINVAKSRATGRAFIEGMTEAIGVPEFGILSPGRYGVGLAAAVREVGFSSMPRALTKTQLVNRVLGGMGTAGKRIAGQSISESLEEVVADFGNYLMTSYVKDADQGYLKEEPFNARSIINTFTESLFSMVPFTGLTTSVQSINEYNNGQRLSASQWAVANNSNAAISYIKDQQIKGKIPEKEALRQINEVNRLKDILGSMEDIKNIKDLRTLLDDPEAQRRYFNLRVHKDNLTEIDYDSLSEEEKKVLNNYTLNEKINDNGKTILNVLEEKRKELTPEELDTLATLKAKKKKTEEEKNQEKKLSERGQLSKEEMRLFFDLQKFAGMRIIDRSQLSTKDYKTLLDAKVITEEDLTPKKEDLEKQLKDTDEKLYKSKELADKYETLTKEQKNEIVTKLFQDVIDETSQSNSPAELVETIEATRKQLDLIKNFNTLNPLDYDLRASLVEAATQRFEELVTKDASGINNFTKGLVEEDVAGLTVAELQTKNTFMEAQAKKGYVDETSQKELTTKYLSEVYNQILNFNKATEDQKIEILVKYFDTTASMAEYNKQELFQLENLLNDWTIIANNVEVVADISEELFDAAQKKYFDLRTENRAAGNSGSSVTSPIVSAPVSPAVTVVTQEDYPAEESVYSPKLQTIEETESKDPYSKHAEEILAGMKNNNYTNVAKTLVATFSAKINEFANVKKIASRAPLEVHKKITRLLEDVINSRKDFNTAYAEALAILNAEFPESQDLNLIYRKTTKFYMSVANVLSEYVSEEADTMTEEEMKAAKAANVEMEDISTELGGQSTEEVHDSVDLQKKEAALKAQEAQVMSWVNPLRTAAFETNKEVVSEDPARVRNAEILNFVQNNPNAERRIQVSSREYFYKQILKGEYQAFVSRLQKAINEKDISTETLNELQAFFGGDFFAVQPTATGVAELIYLIQSEGEGLLKNPAPIVTFVVGEQLETFESGGKAYPFYANLSLAKHLENVTEAVEGVQAREVPTIVTDYKKANPEGFKAAVESGLALITGLRNEIAKDPSAPVVFDLDYITQGFRIGSKIVPLQEVEAPLEVTFKTKKANEDNGLLYPGTVGQGVALINGQPYLLFNQFITEVGGLSELEALAELIYNPEARAEFFDESIELIDYISTHYNIFQAGSRKLEFSLKKGELEVFSVSIEKGKKKFTRINTPEEFISFMTKTDTPGVRYNISKEGLGTKTRMFSMEDGKIVEQEMTYTQFVRKTHKILFSEDPNFRNKQIVFNEQSLRGVVKPVIINPPTAPTVPAVPAKKEEEGWSFPERKPETTTKGPVDYTSTANKILAFSNNNSEFKKQAESDLEVKNFIETVLGFSIDQNPPSLIKERVQNYLEKQKKAPVSTDAKADIERRTTKVISSEIVEKGNKKGQTRTVTQTNSIEEIEGIKVSVTEYEAKVGDTAVTLGGRRMTFKEFKEEFPLDEDYEEILGDWPDLNDDTIITVRKIKRTHSSSRFKTVVSIYSPVFGDKMDITIKQDNAKYDAELAALEGAKSATKPNFSKEVSFDTVVNTLNSVVKSMWEQMPESRRGKVTISPAGVNEYHVKVELKGTPIQGKIEIVFPIKDSQGKERKIPMPEILEARFAPNLKEVGQRPDGTPIFEEEGIKTFPVDLTNFEGDILDWNNVSFKLLFTESETAKLGYKGQSFGEFPKDILDVLNPNEFLGNIISQLSGETVVPKAEPPVNPLAAAIMEQAKAPVAPETVQENVFTEEETKKGEDLKNNCAPPINKAGKFKPMSGKTNKK